MNYAVVDTSIFLGVGVKPLYMQPCHKSLGVQLLKRGSVLCYYIPYSHGADTLFHVIWGRGVEDCLCATHKFLAYFCVSHSVY